MWSPSGFQRAHSLCPLPQPTAQATPTRLEQGDHAANSLPYLPVPVADVHISIRHGSRRATYAAILSTVIEE
jgi:hypothetical protein